LTTGAAAGAIARPGIDSRAEGRDARDRLPMNLPSLDQLAAAAARTFRRFPLALCDALLGAAAAVAMFELTAPARSPMLGNVVLAAALGLPLFTALPLVAHKRRWSAPAGLALQGGAALLLLAYALSLPRGASDAPSHHMIRFMFLDAASTSSWRSPPMRAGTR